MLSSEVSLGTENDGTLQGTCVYGFLLVKRNIKDSPCFLSHAGFVSFDKDDLLSVNTTCPAMFFMLIALHECLPRGLNTLR